MSTVDIGQLLHVGQILLAARLDLHGDERLSADDRNGPGVGLEG
jgi:hypothetical protein